jgi:hypothetical protein
MTVDFNNTQSAENDIGAVGVKSFLQSEEVINITRSFHSNMVRREVDVGFNVFALVSDVYHKENLHSDVLAAILDPEGLHKRGDLFLRLFLEYLREHHGLNISAASFQNSQVVRESGRMDLLIFDDVSREAIIIENKINGAGDMERQVARYLKDVEDTRRYRCKGIVYLTLHQKGQPSYRGWSPSEIQRVTPLLVPVAAFDDSPQDLCSGWLARCVKEATATDDGVRHVLQQYHQIILKMGQDAMNQPLMETFLDMLRDPNCQRTVSSIATMWRDLPAYRSLRLFERFRGRHSPFFEISLYRPTLLMFEGIPLEKGARIKIHIDTSSDKQSLMVFWDNEDDSAALPRAILSDLGMMDHFSEHNVSSFAHAYAFPAGEDALGDDLERFLQQLREYVEGKQTSARP